MDRETKELELLIRNKLEKLEKIKDKGIYPFGRSYDKKDNIEDITKEGVKVKTAGRIMSYRRQGKASFGHLEDFTKKIQFYVKRDDIGEENYDIYKLLGAGDFMGIEGTTFFTTTGELTIKVEKFELLSKNIRPLPEKYHGLKDVETRYRHRYIDLIMNKEVKDTFNKRSQIINHMRSFLVNKKFIEVETPMMHEIAGGALAKPFITHHETLDMELYLRIAPELHLKRLIVGGYERVFEINRNFRNEGISTRHNPEFTSMELYQAYANYEDMMDITEDMVSEIAKEVCGSYKVNYQGTELNFAKPWRRITMSEAVKENTGYDFDKMSLEEAKEAAKKLGIDVKSNSKNKIMNLIFEEKVESKIIQPTFIYKYPKEISPLAKSSPEDKDIADRFELFVFGRELANAYSELNDPIEQKRNFESQINNREEGDDEYHKMDNDYIHALECGMPPTGGLGIGIDRLVMFFTDSQSIRDVIFFPQLRKK